MDETLKSEEAPNTHKEKIFLSKFNQKADQNTQAPRIGKFKNILEEGITHLNPKAIIKNKKNSTTFAKNPTSTLTRSPTSILSHPIDEHGAKVGDGLSATDDYLKGVSIGPNTLLNTQEFKYYAFYERIREMLVERWKTHIQREIALRRSPASSNLNLSTGSKITSLIVKLDEKGQIQEIEKIGLSGIERFDNAAVLSFHEAAPFPHPPVDMIKNGSLSIRWDFVVVVDQASLFDFRVSRGL
jgi:protein TonB